jgi:hypothetical protein
VARARQRPARCVSVNDSVEFLRHEGIDRFADGCAVQVYPDGNPNLTLRSRVATLEASVLAACGRGARPCWMTEWGFNNPMQSCPLNDSARMRAVEVERAASRNSLGRDACPPSCFIPGAASFPARGSMFPRTVDPGSISAAASLPTPARRRWRHFS